MSSQSSWKFYEKLSQMSPVRAIAESLFNTRNNGPCPRVVTPLEAYQIAAELPSVTVTDLIMDASRARVLGLPEDAKVIVDNNGAAVGRSASARVFYNRLPQNQKEAAESILREGVYELTRDHDLIIGEAVVGTDPDLMFKARLICPEEDAANLFFWFANFTPLAAVPGYKKSKKHPVQDILFITYPDWRAPKDCPWGDSLAVVDEKNNTIFNFGMRYFGERKKGTLTLAWTAAQRMGHVSAHGGIKEVDFTETKFSERGKQVIAFYGLSGSGKSSHTNSLDNGGTLPHGFKRRIAHDDAFQIDAERKLCYVWEPTLFDKTDSRDLDHPDWKYCVGVMNSLVIDVDGQLLPYGMDTRNANGRAIFARELLGETCDRIGFPNSIGWLMKDDALPPLVKITDNSLAVAMGATLMTKRTAAENISPEEMKKLVFEPFANPFRVYPLYKDCRGYAKVFAAGCECHVWSGGGGGFWNGAGETPKPVPLQTSLTLQTAVLLGQLEWEPWDLIEGAALPTRASIEKVLPGYYDMYDPANVPDRAEYLALLKDRFEQRVAFLKASDITEKPELLARLVESFKIKV